MNKAQSIEIVFLFYDGMTALDAIGPHEILSRLPGAKVFRVAEKAGPVHTDATGLQLIAEHGLEQVQHADVLLLPGSGRAASLKDHPITLQWIQKIHQTTLWTTSVCTGSLILGAAGLLKGVKATSHWAALERLSQWGALPTAERVVEAGKILTAAGVSAGIDMALTLAAKLAGTEWAQTLQLAIEYDPHPPFDRGSPKKAPPQLLEKLRQRMIASFEKNP